MEMKTGETLRMVDDYVVKVSDKPGDYPARYDVTLWAVAPGQQVVRQKIEEAVRSTLGSQRVQDILFSAWEGETVHLQTEIGQVELSGPGTFAAFQYDQPTCSSGVKVCRRQGDVIFSAVPFRLDAGTGPIDPDRRCND
jgi:hypothetical protein